MNHTRVRSTRGRRGAIVTGLTVALIVMAGCSGDDEVTGDTDAPSTQLPPLTEAPTDSALRPAESALPPAGEGGELTIQDRTFSALTVAAGAEFSISNLDGFAHTVTSDQFDVRVEGGSTDALTIDAPGTYAIFCKIHPSMQGTIVVE